jgi:hypothetical protein
MIRIFLFFLLLVFPLSVLGETLEERVHKLEEKVKKLEERLNALEGKENSLKRQVIKKPIPKIETPVLKISNPNEIFSYSVLKKKFEKASIKESLWKRNDQIILKMKFTNKLDRPLYAVKGKVAIFDKNGKKLMETNININKALNFFRGTKIKPGETLKYEVSFTYDRKNPDHRFVKDTPLEDLTVKFFPTEIHFGDGSVKYIDYKEDDK